MALLPVVYIKESKSKITAPIMETLAKENRLVGEGKVKIEAHNGIDRAYIDPQHEEMVFMLFDRGSISEKTVAFSDVSRVEVDLCPQDLNAKLADFFPKYTLAGAMVGDIGGLMAGALIDGLSNKNKSTEFKLDLSFWAEGFQKIAELKPVHICLDGRSNSFEVEAAELMSKIQTITQQLDRHFGDRIKVVFPR